MIKAALCLYNPLWFFDITNRKLRKDLGHILLSYCVWRQNFGKYNAEISRHSAYTTKLFIIYYGYWCILPLPTPRDLLFEVFACAHWEKTDVITVDPEWVLKSRILKTSPDTSTSTLTSFLLTSPCLLVCQTIQSRRERSSRTATDARTDDTGNVEFVNFKINEINI